MVNSENIYRLAQILDAEITVVKNGLISVWKYINGKLCKIK